MSIKNILIIALLAIIMLLLFRNCGLSKRYKQYNNLVVAMSDTLSSYKNEKGQMVSKITALESDNFSMFLNLMSKDSTITNLQKIVKENKSRIKNGGSVTIFETITKIDTTVGNKTDTIYQSDGQIVDVIIKRGFEIQNKWIDLVGFISDSTEISLAINNEYEVIIGKEKRKPFVEITNLNPYTTTKTLRTYQVKLPKPKRFGIGINAGYGISYNGKFILAPYLGVGFNINLITF